MHLPAPFGRYTLLKLLGQGGAGRVYKAELRGPAGFRKRLALKVLSDDTSHTTAEGLRREARIGGMLKHPNLVDTYDFGDVDGRMYIAMELVDGAALSTILRKSGALAPSAFLDLAGQLCAGVGALHAIAGLVHRDLKPGNVLVDRAGLAKVGDFGISQAGSDEAPEGSGTLGYMAPEQLEEAPADARTDVFSLGLLLYEAIAGERVIAGQAHEKAAKTYAIDNQVRTMRVAERADERLPGLGPALVACLRRDREARPASTAELWELLRNLQPAPSDGPTLAWRAVEVAGGSTVTSGPRTPGATTASRLAVGRVPSTADPFFGRERELAALAGLIGEARLVTVKGPGGVGKSRLLLQVVQGARDRFEGGAWWVPLAETTTPGGCAVAVGRTIGVRVADHDSVDGIGQALFGLGPALVVLDDADGVAASLGPTIGRWLDAAPDLHVAITCRTILNAVGERIVEVGPLARKAAVALLRQRAGARGITWDDDAVVGELADRLDRLPLALELAAGRAGTLGPRQLLERLDDRFRLLGARGRSARQSTLKAVLESSFASLAPWERDAMAQLSVFRGGFRLENAEEVVELSAFPDAPWMLDVVSRLWETSLVRSRETAGQPRFHVLESVREFAAAELAASGRLAAVRERHARAFVRMDHDHESPGRPDRSMAERLQELDNLVAACDTAMAGADGVLAAHLVIATNAIVRHVAPVRRAIERTSELLDRFSLPPLLRSRAQASRGILLHDVDDDAVAERDLRAAAESYVRLGERWRRAAALNNLGAVLRSLGRPDEARAQYDAVIEIARSIGAPVLEASAEANLGALVGWTGADEGEARFRRAAELLDTAGPHDPSLDATVFSNLAILRMMHGDADGAAEWAERSLEVCRRARIRKGAHGAENVLAGAAEMRGDLLAMRAHLEACLRLADDLGDRALAAAAELDLARWGLRAAELDQARGFVERGLARLGRSPSGPLFHLAQAWLGEIRVRAGDAGGLAQMLAADEALEGAGELRWQVRLRRASIALSQGDLEAARARVAELRAAPEASRMALPELAEIEQQLREPH